MLPESFFWRLHSTTFCDSDQRGQLSPPARNVSDGEPLKFPDRRLHNPGPPSPTAASRRR